MVWSFFLCFWVWDGCNFLPHGAPLVAFSWNFQILQQFNFIISFHYIHPQLFVITKSYINLTNFLICILKENLSQIYISYICMIDWSGVSNDSKIFGFYFICHMLLKCWFQLWNMASNGGGVQFGSTFKTT